MLKIKTFENIYSPEDAEGILLNCDSKINIAKMTEVYYPYKRIKYNLTIGGRLSKLDKEVNCIIDLVSAVPAVGQGMPNFVEIEVDESIVLERVVTDERLYEIGHNFVFKLFLNRSKILHTPNIAIEEEELFHKMFYITQCLDNEGVSYFVLVDSIDGGIAILDWKQQAANAKVQAEVQNEQE